MLLAVSSTRQNERGPEYADQALVAIHRGNPGRLPIRLIYAFESGSVGLYCQFPDELKSLVENQLATAYGLDSHWARLPENTFDPPSDYETWTAQIRLEPELFPILRYAQYEDALNRNLADPLAQILSAIAPANDAPTLSRVDLVLTPVRRRRQRQARRAVEVLALSFFRHHHHLADLYASHATAPSFHRRVLAWGLGTIARGWSDRRSPESATTPSRRHDREADVSAAVDKVGRHLFEARLVVSVSGPVGRSWKTRQKVEQIAGSFGVFTAPHLATFRVTRASKKARRLRRRGFLLSTEEAASLWHPPTQTVRAPKMHVQMARELEAPVSLPSKEKEPDVTVLGRVNFRSRSELFGLRPADRLRHVAIFGKTGVGKSTLLGNMMHSDIIAGSGLGLIDPHGDLAEGLLASIPKDRTNDVIAFDAGDRTCPIGFNPLDCQHPDQRTLVASGVVVAFKKMFGDSWGPRLEYIFRNAILALLETPGTTLLSLQRLLSDQAYRKQIVGRVSDPAVRLFWQREFDSWKPQFQAEAVSPVQNKIGQFASNELLRSVLGQPKSSFHLRDVLDRRQLLIVNLSIGRLGEDASALLGSLLVSSIQIAAMSRADVPPDQRPPFHLYIDEIENYATESFATILSQSRKYGLSICTANQYLAQLDEATYHAIFGNAASFLAFQVSSKDAEILAEQFAGDVTPQDLINLPRYAAYAKLAIDGMPTPPFSMTTLPPVAVASQQRRGVIERASRRRYGRPIHTVKPEIEKALGV